MKFFGNDIRTEEKGYFGVRRCSECADLRDVDLVEINAVYRVFYAPIKNMGTKRFLVCSKCGAALEISKDMWNFYNTYKRFDKQTTDLIIDKLKNIDNDLNNNNVALQCGNEECNVSLGMIVEGLKQKFGNHNNVEELVSIYFSRE